MSRFGVREGFKFERIQILRFLAAAAVVACHAEGGVEAYFQGRPALAFLRNGAYGVDLFFVISGFIISYTARTRENQWRLFLTKRVLRVVPLYWFYTILFFAVQTSLVLAFPSIVNSSGITAYKIPQSLAFISWAWKEAPVLAVGWSLEFEMFFYLALAAAMAWRLPSTITVAVIFCLAQVAWLVHPEIKDSIWRFLVDPILLEFVFGILCSELLFNKKSALIVASLAVFGLLMPNHGRQITVGLTAFVLVGAALALDLRFHKISVVEKAMVSLGNASYSIYLVQALTNSLFVKTLHIFRGYLNMDIAIILIVIASCGSGYVMYLLVEKPMTTYFHRKTKAKKGFSLDAVRNETLENQPLSPGKT